MNFIRRIFSKGVNPDFRKQLRLFLGMKPGNPKLYEAALSHKSVKELPGENNERLEYLGDAVLSSIVADYLFKKYPYKGEGFLTEMRSKMVNRHQLNDIALKMGLRKLTQYNRFDTTLKSSQIFGNTLEAIIGAIYIDKGYVRTRNWVLKNILIPHFFMDDLEQKEINLKNKLIGWASKNGKKLDFETINEKVENGRRIFTIAVIIDGIKVGEGKGFNKKDANQAAVQQVIHSLKL